MRPKDFNNLDLVQIEGVKDSRFLISQSHAICLVPTTCKGMDYPVGYICNPYSAQFNFVLLKNLGEEISTMADDFNTYYDRMEKAGMYLSSTSDRYREADVQNFAVLFRNKYSKEWIPLLVEKAKNKELDPIAIDILIQHYLITLPKEIYGCHSEICDYIVGWYDRVSTKIEDYKSQCK